MSRAVGTILQRRRDFPGVASPWSGSRETTFAAFTEFGTTHELNCLLSHCPRTGRRKRMGETLQRGSSAVAHPARSWLRGKLRWICGFGLVGLTGMALLVTARLRQEPDCKAVSRGEPNGLFLAVCQREYERTRSPRSGIYLADARLLAGDTEGSRALANALLSTDVRADALQILGKIANKKNQLDDASRLLQDARQLHREQGNHYELARDCQLLAKVQMNQEQYAEALATLDECTAEARAANDPRIEAYCRLTAANVLIYAGYFEAAHQQIDRAAPNLKDDDDLAQLWFMRGELEQEVIRGPLRRAHNLQAVSAYERSLRYATSAQSTGLILNLYLNLAYSLAELKRVDDADHYLSEAGLLDRDGAYVSQRTQLSARIAYHRDNLTLASTLNSQVYPTIEDDDEKIEVCVMQARIALASSEFDKAASWANQAAEIVERVRTAETRPELRPWTLASRREPLEVLFTALARADKIKEAFIAFDQWQGRMLLDELARPSTDPSPGLSRTATRIQTLWRWLPAVTKVPLMTEARRPDLAALGKVDLVALAVADETVWRLTAHQGKLDITRLGEVSELRQDLDRFIASPTDTGLADRLGSLILPEDVFHKTTKPLYVVLDAPLAGLPIPALRRNDQALIAVRPVVRAPRFPVEGDCRRRTEPRSALVLADAAGDLPDARRESSRVASLFGTTPLVGAAATSAALFSAKSDPLLHIAVHADVDSGGGVLKLHDRAVSAAEISANQLGPDLVVLAGCNTASSWDPELANALSTAFLAGGAQRVIATLRPVSDAGARELTTRFYDAGGDKDPVGVLARVQEELAHGENRDWPNFAVFGNEMCPGT